MSEYYQKLKQLIEVKRGIKEVKERAEVMRREQQEEERKLGEKEMQFYVVDRLGLVMLLQKYLVAKRKRRSNNENQMELEILKKYYANKESFSTQAGGAGGDSSNQSPSKGSPSKKMNVYDMMEQRIEKLKKYQAYYTQNWGIISKYQFEFGFIHNRYSDLML